MKLNDLINDYKKGKASEKLGIISNVLTILTAVFAIITSQFFVLKYIVDSRTYITIGFYIFALGISLIAVYLYQLWVQYIFKIYTQTILRIAFILIATSSVVFALVIIWSFILQFQIYS